ncbi:hypothetical protein COCNU_scaffold074608G000010 [Cocos nucifera]|nr:hypothetical protein [Cocos nucifera]
MQYAKRKTFTRLFLTDVTLLPMLTKMDCGTVGKLKASRLSIQFSFAEEVSYAWQQHKVRCLLKK